jgi:hypothetical protein
VTPHEPRGAFMPIEFGAAAYRFGHSMVRPSYRANFLFTLPLPAIAPHTQTAPTVLPQRRCRR